MAELTTVYEGYARTPPPPATVGTPASRIQEPTLHQRAAKIFLANKDKPYPSLPGLPRYDPEGLRIAKHGPLSAITLANKRRKKPEPKEGTVFPSPLKRKETPAPAPKPKPIDARRKVLESPVTPPPLPRKEAPSPKVAFEPTTVRRKEKKPTSA